MGEAKRRGTFEERKAQAMANGRKGREKSNTTPQLVNLNMTPTLAALLNLAHMFDPRRRGKP